MKCTACQVELVDNLKEHYKSDLHKLNVQRQMYHIPPISKEEFELEGASSDVSVDISLDTKEFSREIKNKNENKLKQKIVTEICLFCEKEESFEHYLEHDLNDNEISYLLNKTCYVCNEGFTNKPGLKKHLQDESHRTAVIKNKNLVLENGKIIYNRGRNIENEQIVRSAPRNTELINFKPKVENFEEKNQAEKNKLKTSMNMNSQKHFRPDWMQ
ncbi:uncharacterized protein VNE69_07247 [Vairimorpha necatrix]|uniref:C2H2-type domain-containing protein n=1 Tax=Vairimorpha necatrix TaxID=6039 RepID=A0AAX4JDX9_9MICR